MPFHPARLREQADRHPRRYAALGLLIVIAIAVAPLLLGLAWGAAAMAASASVIFIWFWGRGPVMEQSGLRPRLGIGRSVTMGLAFGAVLFALFKLVLEPGLELLLGMERNLDRLDALEGNLEATLLGLLMVWVTAAFYEELFYRSFLLRAIAGVLGGGRWAILPAVILSSALFAAAHGYQGPVGLIVTLLGALILAGLFLRFGGNLWLVIAAHGLFDTGTIVLAYLGIYRQITGWLLG